MTEAQQSLLVSAKQRLYQTRSQRPRPHLDDKIITAWNGMMIRALVEAGAVFDQKRYTDAAATGAIFIKNHLLDKDSQVLLRRLREGQAGIDAGLVDYAWYVNGLLALYGNTQDRQWLALAQQLTARQADLFQDTGMGGFFESAEDRNVLFRSRSAYDGALPAPNAIALENLYQLADFTGEDRWQQMADRTLASFAASINSNPGSAGWMLSLISSEQVRSPDEAERNPGTKQ